MKPLYLLSLLVYFLYYFLSYFCNYLLPVFLEKGLRLTVVSTAGYLIWFSALTSLGVIVWYFLWGSKHLSKKWLMVCALLTLSIGCISFALLSPDAPVGALWVRIAGKGSVWCIIPLAGIAFREVQGGLFSHAYRNKNLLRQWSDSIRAGGCSSTPSERSCSTYLQTFVNPFNERLNSNVHNIPLIETGFSTFLLNMVEQMFSPTNLIYGLYQFILAYCCHCRSCGNYACYSI